MAAQLLRTVEDARAFTRQVRARGQRLALVPTMGFLHEGHLSLMRGGKERADVCAATIFVNPAQFGPKEDLSRYPRDLDGDLRKCASAGVDAVWAPERAQVYPPGYQTYVEVTELSKGLCGERRPGHFRGVATVVAKLLALFRPDVALFGEKDFQQLRVIQRLNADLDLAVEVVGLPIVREPDGLAMSSRNSYLSAAERQRALSLHRGLKAAQALCGQGVVTARELVGAVRAELEREGAGVRPDYVELVDSETLAPIIRVADQPARLLVAAYVGSTRLIDNLELREPSE
ncbi:MAG TPA: pantoate--beta-alanine ligase [Myxococcales bacterium]|jgi:pantoate--beta-alanine ligase|nr:pantoate--beta-alanine ligase [Myxococcales bacterium]